MKVLLHACCGPCASACVPRLKELGHEVTMFFANSNISDAAEFEKRKQAAQQLAEADGVALVAQDYDHDEWLKEVASGYEDAPEKGARCERCFRYNLAKAAAYAAAHGFDAFTTSLTVSPHKVSEQVFEAGRSAEAEADRAEVQGSRFEVQGLRSKVQGRVEGQRLKVEQRRDKNSSVQPPTCNLQPVFLEENFKKREGFKKSLKRSAELGLYRQSWCGCEFSKREGEGER